MASYPTEKDIKKHEKQLINDFRQYLFFNYDLSYLKNSLRNLHTDIILDANNRGVEVNGEVNFDKFLKKLLKHKSSDALRGKNE